MTETVHCKQFTHLVPSDAHIHPNTTWTALKSSLTSSHLLTADPFGAATHLWSIDKGALSHISSLQPPLPAGIPRIFHNSISKPGLFVVGFDKPNIGVGVLRLYDVSTGGEMVYEMTLQHAFNGHKRPFVFECHSEFVAVSLSALDSDINTVQVFKYEPEEGEKLKEVTRVSVVDKDHTPLAIINLFEDGSLLTAHSDKPKLHLSLHRGIQEDINPTPSIRATLNPAHDSCDFLEPSSVIHISDSLLALAIEESSSEHDHHASLAMSTIHFISLPSLSTAFSIPLPHVGNKFSHHPSLNAITTIGSRYIPDTQQWTPVITFLSDRTGAVIRQAYFGDATNSTAAIARRALADELVLVSDTGRISVTSLKDLIDGGGIREWQTVSGGPAPFNAKAKKAGEKWKWVEHALISHDRSVLLFPVRGPDLYFVNF